MKELISFIKGIGTAISAFFSFVFSVIQDLVYLVQLTAKMVAEIPNYFSWLPAPLFALIGVAITIAVLYKVLGRE